MPNISLDQLVAQIKNLDSGLKQEANKAVNQLLTIRNWIVGYYIVEYEQQGGDRAQYGAELLKKIAERLDTKGLSETNLKLCRQFFIEFPEVGSLIDKSLIFNSLLIGQTPSDLFSVLPTKTTEEVSLPDYTYQKDVWSNELSAKVIQSLSFSHITLLLQANDALQRAFYAVEAIKGTWSVRELKRQMNTLLFERSGLSKEPKFLIQKINEANPTSQPEGLVKDLYTFEFLGLPHQNIVEESDLETALLDHLREFILELGNGFCLEARQKRILIGNEYFFIDLVFYHRILKCHVLIELKVEEFTHANAGQLNTYLTYYQRNVQEASDNPPVGILLVTDKNDALVEYATAGMDEQLFVSRYLLNLPDKEKLEKFVREEISAIK